ncbi:MAG: helix-turn-helix transcriptional regulator [Terriglobales bacterium]
MTKGGYYFGESQLCKAGAPVEFFAQLWDWYWTHKAQIPVDVGGGNGNLLIAVVLAWNWATQFDLVRVVLLVSVAVLVWEKVGELYQRFGAGKVSGQKGVPVVAAKEKPGTASTGKAGGIEKAVAAASAGSMPQASSLDEQVGDQQASPEESVPGGPVAEGVESNGHVPMTIEELKAALVQADKMQTELADALGVNRSYISKILAGKKPFTAELQNRCHEVLVDWGVALPEKQTGVEGHSVNS